MHASRFDYYSRAQELFYKNKQILDKLVSRKILSAAMG